MIDKLEMLLALAREQHFGRAAEACGITQPTLSAGLKQLEESFGLLLVHRQSRFLGFTPEGQRVLDWARRIVGDARAMHQEIRALKQGLAGHLRLAAVPTALPIVAELTTPLRERHPDVVFTVVSRNSIDVLTQLDNLEVDAGVTYVYNEPLGRARFVPLYQERYHLLIAADAPLGRRAQVELGGGRQHPAVLAHPGHAEPPHHRSPAARCGRGAAPTLQSNSMVVLFSHVRTGRWASVMPAVLAETMGLTTQIRVIPIDDTDPPMIGLVYPQREPLTPLTAALVTEAHRLGQAWGGGGTIDFFYRGYARAFLHFGRAAHLIAADGMLRLVMAGFARTRSRPQAEGERLAIHAAANGENLEEPKWPTTSHGARRAAPTIIAAHAGQDGAAMPMLHALQAAFGCVPVRRSSR